MRNSRPIFKVERYKLSDRFRQLAAHEGVRVALLADADEVRAFREESRALNWLTAQSREPR